MVLFSMLGQQYVHNLHQGRVAYNIFEIVGSLAYNPQRKYVSIQSLISLNNHKCFTKEGIGNYAYEKEF